MDCRSAWPRALSGWGQPTGVNRPGGVRPLRPELGHRGEVTAAWGLTADFSCHMPDPAAAAPQLLSWSQHRPDLVAKKRHGGPVQATLSALHSHPEN